MHPVRQRVSTGLIGVENVAKEPEGVLEMMINLSAKLLAISRQTINRTRENP
jgi:hypothetical protein